MQENKASSLLNIATCGVFCPAAAVDRQEGTSLRTPLSYCPNSPLPLLAGWYWSM